MALPEKMRQIFEYSHAIVKDNINQMKLGEREKEEMREEHCNFVKTLTYLGINVIEIAASRTESLQQSSQFTNMIGDLVFIINGVALFLQPHDRMREKEIQYLISLLRNDFFLRILEIKDPDAFISAQDILFTGKELFVGINGSTTNAGGALIFANAFPEYSTQILVMPSNCKLPLRSYISPGGSGVLLTCSSNSTSLQLANSICAKAKYTYEFLDLPHINLVNSLFLNNTLLHLEFGAAGGREVIEENLKIHAALQMRHLLRKHNNMAGLCILVPKLEVLQALDSIVSHEDLQGYQNC